MKKLVLLAALLVGGAALSGCVAGAAYASRPVANGFLYAETQSGEQIDTNAIGAKTGQACTTSILGLVTTGDATYVTAAKNGAIKKVATVDNRYKNILGIWAEYCVVVTGE
jgi:hypothetical protein